MKDTFRPTEIPKHPAKSERSAKLAEALRANLARRKAQKRARAEQPRGKDSQED
ncbi:hypothetical protein [Amaricoccus macauensis]|uniref:hypothetical protein n=1 Tax=Amaricoccus macauensis TaxID=57001 RepID=UPI003C7AAA6F